MCGAIKFGKQFYNPFLLNYMTSDYMSLSRTCCRLVNVLIWICVRVLSVILYLKPNLEYRYQGYVINLETCRMNICCGSFSSTEYVLFLWQTSVWDTSTTFLTAHQEAHNIELEWYSDRLLWDTCFWTERKVEINLRSFWANHLKAFSENQFTMNTTIHLSMYICVHFACCVPSLYL